MEIIIRFFTIHYPEINFVLSFFYQTQFNNSFNAITDLSVNEINYGFKIRETFSSFTEPIFFYLPTQRLKYRQETANVSAFVNAKAKIYYDSLHMPFLFNEGDKAYLELHHGYELPRRFNKRVSQQRCGPFRVLKRVGRLAYDNCYHLMCEKMIVLLARKIYDYMLILPRAPRS